MKNGKETVNFGKLLALGLTKDLLAGFAIQPLFQSVSSLFKVFQWASPTTHSHATSEPGLNRSEMASFLKMMKTDELGSLWTAARIRPASHKTNGSLKIKRFVVQTSTKHSLICKG
jgi:hypothetical protein